MPSTQKFKRVIVDIGEAYAPDVRATAESRGLTLAEYIRRAARLLIYFSRHPDREIVVTNSPEALSKLGLAVRELVLYWGTPKPPRQVKQSQTSRFQVPMSPALCDGLDSLSSATGMTVKEVLKTAFWAEARLASMITSTQQEETGHYGERVLTLVKSSDPEWGMKLPEGIAVRRLDIPFFMYLEQDS